MVPDAEIKAQGDRFQIILATEHLMPLPNGI